MDFAVVSHPGKGLESLKEIEKDSVLHVTEDLLCKNLEGTTVILTAGVWELLYSWTPTGRLLRFARALAWVAMILHWFYRKIGFPWKEWSINNLIVLRGSKDLYLLLCNSGEVKVSTDSVPLLSLFPEKNQFAVVFWSRCLYLDFWVKVQVIIHCLTLLHTDVFVFPVRFLGQGANHYPLPCLSACGCFHCLALHFWKRLPGLRSDFHSHRARFF